MKIILEGARGAGKTALAEELSKRTGVPVYRPFRGTADHISPQMVSSMQTLGLSVNGWEEDLYTADFLSVVNASVIIDRSMPSALAYNEVSSTALLAGYRAMVVQLWADRIAAARAILVFVRCSVQTRFVRAPERQTGDWEVNGIRAALLDIHRWQQAIPIWEVDSEHYTADKLADAIVRRATLGTRSQLIGTLAGPDRESIFLDG